MLLMFGADMRHADVEGFTAKAWAEKNGHALVVAALADAEFQRAQEETARAGERQSQGCVRACQNPKEVAREACRMQ